MLKKMAAAGIIAATATTMFAATPASAAEAATKGTVRFSFGCNGSTKARANFSYNEGTVSTTVYYNNHCSHSVRVTVNMADASGQNIHCLKVPAHKKGSKKYRQGLSGTFKGLSKGCLA